MPQLKAHGFSIPALNKLEEAVTAGIGNLQVTMFKGSECSRLSFSHFVNLVWQPLLSYLDKLSIGEEVAWVETLEVHQTALCLEMEGIVPSPSGVSVGR